MEDVYHVGRRERCLLESRTKKNNSPAKKKADGVHVFILLMNCGLAQICPQIMPPISTMPLLWLISKS